MPSPATANDFLSLIQRSKLVDAQGLVPYLQQLKTEKNVPSKADQLARLLVRDGFLTRYQAEQLLRGKWQRFTLGRYKILERIGAGGMGSVFLCEHMHMRRRVAVKVLPLSQSNNQAALERFYREAQAVAALNHRNIVRAYDIDHDQDVHFLALEYVEGANLQQIVSKSGPLEPEKAADYLCQAAQGLQHAFRAGLIHRDIKPANLLVDKSGTIKVLDLGLARFFDNEKDDLTQRFSETVLGTADYMSPEQAIDSHAVDIRADIYSLGGTFYFCLTGQGPFQGSMAEKILAHQTRPPKPIRELRPEVPEWLAGIIEKMMAKRPEDRYQTPGAVAAAVAGKGEGDSPSAAETVVEEPATSPETANLFPPDRPVRRSRRRLAFLLLGLVVLVGLAFCVGRWLLSDRNEAEVATPPSPSAVAVSTLPSQPSEKGTSGKGMSFSFPKSFAGNATVKRNGSAQVPASGVLRLTDKAGQAGSAFYNQKVDITRFTTTFDFRLTKPGGDGFTFTVQAVGPEAVGQAGGGLGYAGIAKSIAVKFDLYDNAGEGPNSTGVFTLGKAPTIGGIPPLQEKNDLRGTGINLHSEHTFTSAITYDGATLTLKITDKETKASITRSYKVNIPEAVGGKSAYVGFTGGTGGALAIQDILSWTFSSTPAP